jgi:hypothetical protein
MSDIVDRLRDGEICAGNQCRVREAASGCACAAAIDEIGRLRAALANIDTVIVQKKRGALVTIQNIVREAQTD